MPITQIPIGGCTWQEDNDSGNGEVNWNAPTTVKKFTAYGPDNETDIVALAESRLNKTINVNGVTLWLIGYKYDHASDDSFTWTVTAIYRYQVGFTEISFDTSGATGKAMVALDDGDYYRCDGLGSATDHTPVGQGVPSFNRLIGVNEENVQGCDITLPDKFDFTVLTRQKLSVMPAWYIDALGRITGKCNKTALTLSYRGQNFPFGVDELAFLGIPGKQNSQDDVEFTLKFSVSRTKFGGTRITRAFNQPAIGSPITVLVRSAASANMIEDGTIYIIGGGYYRVLTIFDDNTVAIQNLGGVGNAVAGTAIPIKSVVSLDDPPIIIGDSDPIAKPGWHHLDVHSSRRLAGATLVGGKLVGGRQLLQPDVVVVWKAIPDAELSIIGIFM